MSAYSDRAGLDRLGANTEPLTYVTDADATAALEAASRLIDGYLASAGIAVPLTAPGADIARAACIIAAYDTVSSGGYPGALEQTNNLRLRYLDTIKWLEEIRDGDITLGGGSNNTDGNPVGAPSVSSSSSRGWSSRGDASRRGPFVSD